VIHSIVPIHRAFHFSVSIIANICVRQLTGPGVYLTDLTFIEDGIPSLIKKTNLINFAKRAKTAEVIRDIQQYQNVPYPLQPVPELQDYILTNMQSAGDVHEMYEMSLSVEPREREDEKIARYTQYFFPQRQQAD
jgi:son of sevenless-like protein